MGAPIDFAVELDLTVTGQDALGVPRLYPGDKVTWRFQVEDEDAAPLDLTGYSIVFTARKRPESTGYLLRRRTGDAIAGASPASNEIVIDADQTVEDTVAFTGRGWFEIRFLPLAAEETELLVALGVSYFDIVLKSATGTVTTFAEGTLEIPRRISRVADVP